MSRVIAAFEEEEEEKEEEEEEEEKEKEEEEEEEDVDVKSFKLSKHFNLISAFRTQTRYH